MKYFIGFITALSVLVAISLAAILAGAVNVAATDPHSALTTWVMNTAMRRSVIARSFTIAPPTPFTEEQARHGFEEFDEMCVTCHGAPGKKRSATGKGLRPQPPNLAEAGPNWSDGNLFWIVKNGIKMTGMPAFGPTHDDGTLWSIVAFVRRLPKMSADQYKQWEDHAAKEHAPEEGHDH